MGNVLGIVLGHIWDYLALLLGRLLNPWGGGGAGAAGAGGLLHHDQSLGVRGAAA